MEHISTWPKHRSAAVRSLGFALWETTPPFGKRIEPESVTESTRLEFKWMLDACERKALDWPYQRKEFFWDCRKTVKDFLDQFTDLPVASD